MSFGKRSAVLRRCAKALLARREDELNAYVRGPLYPRPVLYALLTLFGISAMLGLDWFGLLLLNSEGVVRQMGPLNVLRVTAVLMGASPSPPSCSSRTTIVSTPTPPRRTSSSP